MKVGIIFGGVSREREISFAGGRTVFDNLNKSIFEAVPLFLDSLGNLILLDWQYIYKGTIRDFYPPVAVQSNNRNFQLYAEHLREDTSINWSEAIASVGKKVEWSEINNLIDIAFLALHGVQGEDGSIQGLLNFYNVPFTGSGILPSGIGMNKAFQKEILQQTRFNKTKFFSIQRQDWNEESASNWLTKTIDEIGLPYVVRPANQGSSIGVSIIDSRDPRLFQQAINTAFFIKKVKQDFWNSLSEEQKEYWVRELMDIKADIGLPLKVESEIIYHPEVLLQTLNDKLKSTSELSLESVYEENEVVVESFIEGREFSCVVVEDENGHPIALPPTEIVKSNEVYDYRSKYLPGLSRKVTPIDLPDEAIQHIRKECFDLYRLLRFNVYARIDGFYKKDGTVVLNDPNTTSGMLPSSFFFHQAAEIGLNPSQFITYIIATSLNARIREGGNVAAYRTLKTVLDDLLDVQQQEVGEKIKVGVILGGYSSERHISVESGRNIYEKLSSSTKYEPIPLFLTLQNDEIVLYQLPIHLLLKDNADDIREKLKVTKDHPVIRAIREETIGINQLFGAKNYSFYPKEVKLIDLNTIVQSVFIALHGRPGEDGTLQQYLEQMGIPYNGSPSYSAAITIDKHKTKEILRKNGFLVANDFLIHKHDWQNNMEEVFADLITKINFPIIAKPIDDGCSSAVKKIDDKETLMAFAEAMFRTTEEVPEHLQKQLGLKLKEEFPQKDVILIEELINRKGARHFLEITGGMVTKSTDDGTIAYEGFEPSEALAGEAILSLEEKFLAGQGQNITPARFDKDKSVSEHISKKVQQDLIRAARILGVQGYCRIDAFVRIYDENNVETIIIEVNSLPGMTPATCIFHQAAINGYQPIDFIDQILTFAINKQDIEVH
ncbi:MAG: D-alanine--D-alanine ligase [Bacteroidetes bacterium]|nr:D-alanine--D-alanine ligase [Bacteroidota bacterium]